MSERSANDMLMQLHDIADSCLDADNRSFVHSLIQQASAGQVTRLTDDQIATLSHLYRQHFV